MHFSPLLIDEIDKNKNIEHLIDQQIWSYIIWSIVLLGIYSDKLITMSKTSKLMSCIQVFIAALFIIPKLRSKQISKVPFNRWMDKLWCVPRMDHYSVIRNRWTIKSWKDTEETLMHIAKWKNPVWKGLILYGSQPYDILENV